MANGTRRDTMPAFESAAALLPKTLRGRLQHWRGALLDETNVHPARTMASALGAGYVLGGGLFSALTGRVVATGGRLGLRLAVVPFMSQSIAVLAEGLLLALVGALGGLVLGWWSVDLLRVGNTHRHDGAHRLPVTVAAKAAHVVDLLAPRGV